MTYLKGMTEETTEKVMVRTDVDKGDMEELVRRTVRELLEGKVAPASDELQQASTVVPLNWVQKAMTKSMTASLQIPHLTIGEEVNVTSL